jgi:hypothetical protein
VNDQEDTAMNYHELTRELPANKGHSLAPTLIDEETLVRDARDGMTPAQMVEHKLAVLLQSTLPVSSRLSTAETPRALS